MVERGDVVLLRTGNGHRRAPTADPAGHWQRYPAWHPTCLPWLSEHEVAAIATTARKTSYPRHTRTCMCRCTPSASLRWVCG